MMIVGGMPMQSLQRQFWKPVAYRLTHHRESRGGGIGRMVHVATGVGASDLYRAGTGNRVLNPSLTQSHRIDRTQNAVLEAGQIENKVRTVTLQF